MRRRWPVPARALRAGLVATLVAGALTACSGPVHLSGGIGSATPFAAPSTATTPRPAPRTPTPAPQLTLVNGDGFRLGLPGKPREAKRTYSTPVGKLVGRTYTSVGGGGQWIVTTIPIPRGAYVDLLKEIRISAEGMKGTVIANTPVKIRGKEAREARIRASDRGLRYEIYIAAVKLDGYLFELRCARPVVGAGGYPAVFRQVVASIRFGDGNGPV